MLFFSAASLIIATFLPSSFEPKGTMSPAEFLAYCLENKDLVYQDIFFGGKTQFQGINICQNRYELIKSIAQQYGNSPFSVLDVGAAQGYFSFRIASDFPQAECTMIEHANAEYDQHDSMLYQLCHLNKLNNTAFLHQKITTRVLADLGKAEHFDLVLALLVVHQIDSCMEERKKILDHLLTLGDQIIIEVSSDFALQLRDYVRDELSHKPGFDCTYLGRVNRYYNPLIAYEGYYPNGKGEFYWFKRRKVEQRSLLPKKIKPQTFKTFNGVYPRS
ncbi:MAG: hypothetical protein JSS32_03730 [Verrucomicrobia bacterium]|nr:hypothetical protein [Verrucomicrobiota bacterium]